MRKNELYQPDKRQQQQDQPWLCRQVNAEKRAKTDREAGSAAVGTVRGARKNELYQGMKKQKQEKTRQAANTSRHKQDKTRGNHDETNLGYVGRQTQRKERRQTANTCGATVGTVRGRG